MVLIERPSQGSSPGSPSVFQNWALLVVKSPRSCPWHYSCSPWCTSRVCICKLGRTGIPFNEQTEGSRKEDQKPLVVC